jgi:hypothetical protein
MSIGFQEAKMLFSGGCLLFSSLALIHFFSSYNIHNRSLSFTSAIAVGIAAFYLASSSNDLDKMTSLELAMSSAILGLLEILPIFLAAITLLLFRISLLTNRSVDASS